MIKCFTNPQDLFHMSTQETARPKKMFVRGGEGDWRNLLLDAFEKDQSNFFKAS